MATLSKQQEQIVKEVVQEQLTIEEQKLEEKFHRRLIDKSRQAAGFLRSKFKQQSAIAIIAAFSFLMALVWRDFIVKLVQENIKINALTQYPYLAELYTAIIVTIIAILGITIIDQWTKQTGVA